MDEGYKDTLSADHLERLAWFDERVGQVVPWPEPLPDKRHLATRAKGIYKPDGWDYALSIRILPDSPYEDGHPIPTSGGGWLLSYHQEGDDPDFYTNAAVRQCMQDRIPVGVIRKIDARRHGVQYEVLGLARPVRWYGGYFIFESVNPPATTQVDPLTDVLTRDTEAEQGQDIDDVPADDYDARHRVQRQITQRRGQPEFRAALIRAYGSRCAITRCDAVEALEAAHIRPYRGPDSNVVSNGLPLRSDIHTLYDLDLIAIDPDTYKVALSPGLHRTQYASLAGVTLLDPIQDSYRPDRRVLQSRWDDFHAALRSAVTPSTVLQTPHRTPLTSANGRGRLICARIWRNAPPRPSRHFRLAPSASPDARAETDRSRLRRAPIARMLNLLTLRCEQAAGVRVNLRAQLEDRSAGGRSFLLVLAE